MLLWVAIALAGRNYEVRPAPVMEEVTGTSGGHLAVVIDDRGKTHVEFAAEGVSFWCDEWSQGNVLALIHDLHEFLGQVRTAGHPGAAGEMGPIKRGIADGNQSPQFCNVWATLHDEYAHVRVMHNNACFGTAGCVPEWVTVVLDGTKLTEAILLLEKHGDRMEAR